jgi:hypothetical protein
VCRIYVDGKVGMRIEAFVTVLAFWVSLHVLCKCVVASQPPVTNIALHRLFRSVHTFNAA